MAKGRKPHTIPSVEICIRVPEPLAKEVDYYLLDPVTGKTKYGARSELITKFLKAWVEKVRRTEGIIPYEQREEAALELAASLGVPLPPGSELAE